MTQIHGGDIYTNDIDIDFSVNINPLGIPATVKSALHEAIEKCSEYPDINSQELCQKLSAWLNIPAEYLLFGNGASELFMAISHAVNPDKVLIPVPSFYGYRHAANAAGAELVYYYLKEENDFAFDEDFLAALTEDIDMLFLANPNNPTGKVLGGEYLVRVLEKCRQKNILVVLDECFIEFCQGKNLLLDALDKYSNLIVIRAFTKIFAIPGVRLGYMLCSDKVLLQKVKAHIPEWNLSTFAQWAGLCCMGQDEYISKTIECVKTERDFLTHGIKELEAKGLQIRAYESDANFILIKTDIPLYDRLLQKKILIRDCENFQGLSKGYYRIAVKLRSENEKLLKAIGECVERKAW